MIWGQINRHSELQNGLFNVYTWTLLLYESESILLEHCVLYSYKFSFHSLFSHTTRILRLEATELQGKWKYALIHRDRVLKIFPYHYSLLYFSSLTLMTYVKENHSGHHLYLNLKWSSGPPFVSPLTSYFSPQHSPLYLYLLYSATKHHKFISPIQIIPRFYTYPFYYPGPWVFLFTLP